LTSAKTLLREVLSGILYAQTPVFIHHGFPPCFCCSGFATQSRVGSLALFLVRQYPLRLRLSSFASFGSAPNLIRFTPSGARLFPLFSNKTNALFAASDPPRPTPLLKLQQMADTHFGFRVQVLSGLSWPIQHVRAFYERIRSPRPPRPNAQRSDLASPRRRLGRVVTYPGLHHRPNPDKCCHTRARNVPRDHGRARRLAENRR